MSSTAMHRDHEPTYQQRGGRALEERTKAMIVAAAEQFMTDLIAASGTGDALAHVTTGQVCVAARGYFRRDGSEGPIPKATMWKHFKTIESLTAAVIDTMMAANRPVPEQILALAAGGDNPRRRETVDARRLEARFASRHYDIGQLEAQFDAALSRGDRSDMLYWSAELAERHLRDHRRGDRTSVVNAREWAHRGLKLVDTDSRLDCMLGIRCTHAAAGAETVLSRKPDYEPTALNRIRSIKETELTFAETLGWDLHSLIARFHIDHTRALGEEDPEREMRSMHTVATALPALCGPNSNQPLEPQDRLQADELADLIAGLCRIDMAYADHPDHADRFGSLFGAGVAAVVHDLVACFPATTGERQRHEGNVRALLRLLEFAQRADRTVDPARPELVRDLVEGYRQASVDLLRTVEFDTVRDILVARYLTAKAQALIVGGAGYRTPAGCEGAEPAGTAIIHPKPAGLLQAAIQFYEHAASVTSRRGSAGILRERATYAGAELGRSRPLTDDARRSGAVIADEGEFERIARAINDLVLITIGRRNRFTDKEVEDLIEIIDPMYYYITAGRN